MSDELRELRKAAGISSLENVYANVRGYMIDAQRQVYSAVNAAMVTAY